MRLPRPRRYGPGARFYDVLSLERPLYRSGRQLAIGWLQLRSGDRVLDVGCGTGLNFPYLVDAVGLGGAVVGVDVSAPMLVSADRRIRRHGWTTVRTVQGDAARLWAVVDGPFDAAIFTYSLAVIGEWERAWTQALTLVREGGRVALVDTAMPDGGWRLLRPLAWVFFMIGGVHTSREVWTMIDRATDSPQRAVLRLVMSAWASAPSQNKRLRAGTTPQANHPGANLRPWAALRFVRTAGSIASAHRVPLV